MKTMIHVLLALILATGTLAWAADEAPAKPSVGQKIGSTARQVADDSKAAVQETRKAAVEVGREVAKEAKKGFQEVKKAGQQMGKDIRSGFTKGAAQQDASSAAPAQNRSE